MLSKLIEDLESEKKLTAHLKDDITKLEDNKIRLLKHNNNLVLKIRDWSSTSTSESLA